MAFTGPLEDRVAIHELAASYGDAVTRRDADAWIANWADDAVWELPAIPGMERVEGRAAILAAWLAAMPGWPEQVNIQRCGAIAVEGEAAHGHTYTDELNCDADGRWERWLNRYDDLWVRREGRWLFARRRLTVLAIRPA